MPAPAAPMSPPSDAPSRTLAYRPDIDGLRALAVLPVMCFHAGFSAFAGGFVGVDVFFVVSGYLVTRLILGEGDAFSLARFYERRARRILPALAVVLTASLAAAWWWLLPADLTAFSRSLAAVLGLSSNVYFWRSALDYFARPTDLVPLLHTWSLAVEEQFYLLFPLGVMLVRRLAPRALGAVLAALALASLALAHSGTTRSPMAAFFLLPTRGWELLLGAWLAVQHDRGAAPPPGLSSRAVREGLALAGLASLAVAVAWYSPATRFPGLAALLPTVGTALVIACAGPDTVVGRLLSQRVIVGLGLISYSAYLWHQPLLAFARYQSATPLTTAQLLGLLAVSLLLAAVTWRVVEQPWRDRTRWPRRTLVAASFGAVAMLAGASAAGLATGGAAFRYAGIDRALVTGESGGSAYVVARFDAHRGKPFTPGDARPRILVIGDSFAQDLVNALHEGGWLDRVQLSTRYVAHYCGNLYLPLDQFTTRPGDYDMRRCPPTLPITDDTLRARMQEADAIWLASMWQGWQVPLLPSSLDAIRGVTGGRPVVVFGPKSFGTFRLRDLLGRTVDERAALRWPVAPDTPPVITAMRAALPPAIFVDTQALICGDAAATCRLFTPEGALLSYDGAHLTPDGARYAGARLRTAPALAAWR